MPERNLNIINKINSLLEEGFRLRISNLRKSTQNAQEALALSRELNDKHLIGKCLNHLALYYMIQGEQKLSLSCSEEAIQYFQELGDEQGIADAKYSIASIYYKSDNYHMGLVKLIDCLAIYKKYNDHYNQSRTLKSLGTIYEYFGDTKNAVKSYKLAIDEARLANDKNLESNAYNPLSGIYINQKKISQAYELIEQSIKMKKENGDIRGLAFALYGRGKVYLARKDYKEAEADFKESIKIHLEMNERLGIGMSYYKLGALYLQTKQFNLAKESLQQGIETGEKYNIAIIKFKCYYLMYQMYKKENNIELALQHLESYIQTHEKVINAQTSKIIENYELIKKMEVLERESQIQKEKAEIVERTNRLEEAARVKQEFLSTMSHEIRTPLNAVITISNLLKDESAHKEPELINSLSFAANNLMVIINDILDFTKLDSNKVVLDPKSTHIKEQLINLRNTYDSLAREKKISLILEVDDALHSNYYYDENKLSQILGNLITNAIKYTQKGSVTIVTKKLTEDHEYDLIRFAVRDTGVGIPTKNFNEIFESFSQPKSVTTRIQGGTGLGLAIVKRLVNLFGSEIHLISEEKKGSEFYFDLKLKRKKQVSKKQELSIERLNGKSVLIVDDNLINTLVASKLLSKWGLVTEHASNGEDAILKSKEKKFDYILMDIHMPIMDGYESCSIIRKSKSKNSRTPIFALTADITAEEHQSFNDNFDGILIKPIDTIKLRDALLSV